MREDGYVDVQSWVDREIATREMMADFEDFVEDEYDE